MSLEDSGVVLVMSATENWALVTQAFDGVPSDLVALALREGIGEPDQTFIGSWMPQDEEPFLTFDPFTLSGAIGLTVYCIELMPDGTANLQVWLIQPHDREWFTDHVWAKLLESGPSGETIDQIRPDGSVQIRAANSP